MNDLNINNEDLINLKEKALCVGLNLTSLVKRPDDIDIEDSIGPGCRCRGGW